MRRITSLEVQFSSTLGEKLAEKVVSQTSKPEVCMRPAIIQSWAKNSSHPDPNGAI